MSIKTQVLQSCASAPPPSLPFMYRSASTGSIYMRVDTKTSHNILPDIMLVPGQEGRNMGVGATICAGYTETDAWNARLKTGEQVTLSNKE